MFEIDILHLAEVIMHHVALEEFNFSASLQQVDKVENIKA